MIQAIQIFGWIILVIIPVIFLVAIKPEKMVQSKEIKRIICFILMGIFALGIISSLLSLLQLRGIPHSVWQFLSLWGFRPAVAGILVTLLRGLPRFSDFLMSAGRFIFPLINLLFSAGMIFFFATKVKQLEEEEGSLSNGKKLFKIKKRGLFSFLFLGLITGGIYMCWRASVIARDVNIMCKDDGKKTRGLLLGWFLFPFLTLGIYTFIWFYKLGNRLKDNAPRYNLKFKEGGGTVLTWVTLGLLLIGIGYLVGWYILFKNTNAMAGEYNKKLIAGDESVM